MAKMRIPEDVLEFFRRTGRQGGRARAANHSKRQLSEWGKLGGRPKGSRKRQGKKGGK